MRKKHVKMKSSTRKKVSRNVSRKRVICWLKEIIVSRGLENWIPSSQPVSKRRTTWIPGARPVCGRKTTWTPRARLVSGRRMNLTPRAKPVSGRKMTWTLRARLVSGRRMNLTPRARPASRKRKIFRSRLIRLYLISEKSRIRPTNVQRRSRAHNNSLINVAIPYPV
jgi:hypothetical protein